MNKSEQHPNGFLVTLLHTFKNGMRLRLHRWHEPHSLINDPHDHRTWFISLPIWGSFVEHRFKEVPGDIPIYRCRDNVDKPLLVVRLDGQSGLQLVKCKRRLPLIPYFCSSKEIHTVQPSNSGFAASLVLFGPKTDYSPRVWIKQITTQIIV